MSERTILVTGAAGYVGGYVLAALRERKKDGWRVLGMVRRPAQAAKVIDSGAEPVLADMIDPASLSEALQGVDAVIHLAAVNRDRGGVTMEMINYRGTVALLGAARAAGVDRLVHVIGIGADSRRSGPLSRTQGLAAEAVLGAGVRATVLEAGVIYGQGDVFVSALTGLARLAPFVVVPGNGKNRFEPISAFDVAEAAVNALDLPWAVGQRYQIVGPQVLTLDQIYDQILETLAIKRPKLHLPIRLLRPAVRLMDSLLPEPPVTASLLDLLELDVLANGQACERLLGRAPRPFGENIDFARQVTAGRFLSITLGRRDRRAEAVERS